jgi:hypothetical protein
MNKPEAKPATLSPTHEGGKCRIVSGKRVRNFDRPRIMRRENVTALYFDKSAVVGANAPAGTWFEDDGIVVVCPTCGHKNPVPIGPEGYKIDARGLLWPSVLCENLACSPVFDRYVLLKGWTTMGRFSRKKEREEGVLLYCLVWKKWVKGPNGEGWYLMPFEYCHAASEAEARNTWAGFIATTCKNGEVVAIAPSFDPHVAGDADPRESILARR